MIEAPESRQQHRLRPLTPVECYQLLAAHFVGRIGLVRGAHPEILPVNYRLDGHDVICRVGYPLLAALAGRPVAFEVDEIDLVYHGGRSVLVHGFAEHVTLADEVDRLSRLPLRPWAPGSRDDYVRIVAEQITGRRLG